MCVFVCMCGAHMCACIVERRKCHTRATPFKEAQSVNKQTASFAKDNGTMNKIGLLKY